MLLPATLRDASYIAANMRPGDWAEIAPQLPEGTDRRLLAAWSLPPPEGFAREAWVAVRAGQPVALWGAHPLTVAGNVLSIWAWGTRAMRRSVPEITRHIGERVEVWISEGVTRVEARSLVGHDQAARWMRGLGGTPVPLPAWGSGGEDYVLWWWTEETWRRQKRVVGSQ